MKTSHQKAPLGQPRQAYDEPLWWGLFSAGGVCFAVVLPAVILFIGLLLPLGLLPAEALGHERAPPACCSACPACCSSAPPCACRCFMPPTGCAMAYST